MKNRTVAGLLGAVILAAGAETVVLAPGNGVTLDADAITGAVDVQVNTGTSGGGIVKMNPYSTYSGSTTLKCGLLWLDTLLSGDFGALGMSPKLVLGPGTLHWAGGKGTYTGAVVTDMSSPQSGVEGKSPAIVFDIAAGGDLTLAGAFTNTVGAFVKTGPGTLRIPGGAGAVSEIAAKGGYWDALCLQAMKSQTNGDCPTKGYSGFCIADGTLVLGEKGGTFNINGSASDCMIGTMTKDPVADAGQQETAGVLEVRGGTVNIKNWLGMGAKNGFETTTPDYVPSSGIRVYGGMVYARTSLGMGRNKNAVPQKNADGSYIRLRTCPFIEIHGGEMQVWDTARFSPCDDAGADARIFIDGGKLVCRGTIVNGAPTTGSALQIGNCSDGDISTPSHADITVRDTGVLDVTSFCIVNARPNVTADIKILEGGTGRWNQLTKLNTKAGGRMDLLFDGGVAQLRYGGNNEWIKGDLTTSRIGTRGLTLTVDSTCANGSIDGICCTFTATNTRPGEAACGVTVMGPSGNAAKKAGFRFNAPQAWAGPTRLAPYGVCEFGMSGAFPAESPVTLEALGTLVVTNAAQTFASFTVGGETAGTANLKIQKDCPITAHGAFARVPNTTVAFTLYATKGQTTALSANGTYTLVTAPAANAADLAGLARSAVCVNAATGKSYVFDTATAGETCSLTVTIADASAVAGTSGVWTNAAGGAWSDGANWDGGEAASGAGAVATFATASQAVGATVTVDAPQTIGGVTMTAGDYTLAGETLTFNNGTADAALATVDGTSLTMSAPAAGRRVLATNPAATGGGFVDLGNSLDGFQGELKTGSGTTKISSLAFAAHAADALSLGCGTLWYTGSGETIGGLAVAAGGNSASVLRVDEDLTLTGLSVTGGSLMKKGAGDLILKGNGVFRPGTGDSAFARKDTDTVKVNGDGPTSSTKNLMVSEGRFVIGTADAPSDAPTVALRNTLGVGCRTTMTAGTRETTGELVLNNGWLKVPDYCYLGFYNGMPDTDPSCELNPRITINGGVMSAKAIRMYHDGNGNLMTASPTFAVNGGAVNLSTYLEVAFSPKAASVTGNPVCTVDIRGGTVTVGWDVNVGNAATSPESRITVGGTGTLVVSNQVNLGKVSTAKPQRLFLEAGGTLKTKGMIVKTTGTSEVYFRGGTWCPGMGRASAQGFTFGSATASKQLTAYVGEGGMKLDFSEWEKTGLDSGALEILQPLLHDPDCAGEDGGLELSGHTTAIFRSSANGSTFTGPVVAKDGFVIGVDNGWKNFKDKRFVLKASAGFRASGDGMYINTLTLGEAGGTEPVVLDFCNNANAKQLVCSNAVSVLSPVTIGFHRPGGCCNIYGMREGTFDILYYRAADDANVPLGMFVENAKLPAYSVSYAKADITSGAYAGWKKIVATVAAKPGTDNIWTNAAGGSWGDVANWQEGAVADHADVRVSFAEAAQANVPVTVDDSRMVGRIELTARDAASGYRLTGGPLNFYLEDGFTAPGIRAVTGMHTVDAELLTEDVYERSSESESNGGRTGALEIGSLSNAALVVNGPVSVHGKRDVLVNDMNLGGGTVVFNGTVESGRGVTVGSGTLRMDDLSRLDGKRVTVQNGTFHYTGTKPGVLTGRLATTTSAATYTSIIRLDDDMTVTGGVLSERGGLMKTGPGRLIVLSSTGADFTNRLGFTSGNTSWNNTGANWYWPDNGDTSTKQGSGGFDIDEGEVVLSGASSIFHLSDKGYTLDCFIGSQERGWTYATNYAALTIHSGTVCIPWTYIGHTFNRGRDAKGDLVKTYAEYNQYGGSVTAMAFHFCYDLSDFDTAVQATANLWGGELKNVGPMRFGQTYNKTGVNPPHATFNIHGGVYRHTETTNPHGTHMGYLGSKSNGQQTLNRACDATLNMYGGRYEDVSYIYMGGNGSTSRVNLHGGVLKALNIVSHATTTGTTYDYFAGGRSYVFCNGGTFQPASTNTATSVLEGLTEVALSTNGLIVTTESAYNGLYTIRQPLVHDAEMAEAKDGGLTKTGAGVLALSGANTYSGQTTVSDGTLRIPADAAATALPPASVVAVAADATLEILSPDAAVGGLRVDLKAGAGTVTGFRPHAAGMVVVDNADGANLRGTFLPITVAGAVNTGLTARWSVVVDGDVVPNLFPYVRNNSIKLDGPQGSFLLIR